MVLNYLIKKYISTLYDQTSEDNISHTLVYHCMSIIILECKSSKSCLFCLYSSIIWRGYILV